MSERSPKTTKKPAKKRLLNSDSFPLFPQSLPLPFNIVFSSVGHCSGIFDDYDHLPVPAVRSGSNVTPKPRVVRFIQRAGKCLAMVKAELFKLLPCGSDSITCPRPSTAPLRKL